jgi:hypothetical protein
MGNWACACAVDPDADLKLLVAQVYPVADSMVAADVSSAAAGDGTFQDIVTVGVSDGECCLGFGCCAPSTAMPTSAPSRGVVSGAHAFGRFSDASPSAIVVTTSTAASSATSRLARSGAGTRYAYNRDALFKLLECVGSSEQVRRVDAAGREVLRLLMADLAALAVPNVDATAAAIIDRDEACRGAPFAAAVSTTTSDRTQVVAAASAGDIVAASESTRDSTPVDPASRTSAAAASPSPARFALPLRKAPAPPTSAFESREPLPPDAAVTSAAAEAAPKKPKTAHFAAPSRASADALDTLSSVARGGARTPRQQHLDAGASSGAASSGFAFADLSPESQHRFDRVLCSVQILRELIDAETSSKSAAIDALVPPTLAACDLLIVRRTEAPLRIAGAELLAVLCRRIAVAIGNSGRGGVDGDVKDGAAGGGGGGGGGDEGSARAAPTSFHEASRQLLLAQRETLRTVRDMAASGIGTTDIDALHSRYAALIAAGDVAAAISAA